MKITLWGVRGSLPTTGDNTKEFGGNTSCVEVVEGGWLIILDAGSGMQNLNFSEVLDHQRIDILLTHLHIDHIQGLGFFKPLFDASKEVHIWGPSSNTQTLRTRLGRYFSPPLFPVYFRNLTCKLFLHDINNSSFDIGPFHIESHYIIHPGPTVGFRIHGKRGILAYIPDHEPALGRDGMINDEKWISGGDVALEADLLLHDAQYTAEEYIEKVGWGHCSMEDAIKFAELTHVKHLLLTHHDPMHTDTQLDEIFKSLKEKSSVSFPFELSKEGMQFEI